MFAPFLNLKTYKHIERHSTSLVLVYSLRNNSLNTIQTHLQGFHLWPIAEPHEMMAGAVEEITSLTWVQVEEDTRDDDNTLFKAGLEEVQTIGDSGRETFKVEPKIECRVRNSLDNESHLTETLDDIVSLGLVATCQMGVTQIEQGAIYHTIKWRCRAFISASTLSGSSMGIAASWNGTAAPPSR